MFLRDLQRLLAEHHRLWDEFDAAPDPFSTDQDIEIAADELSAKLYATDREILALIPEIANIPWDLICELKCVRRDMLRQRTHIELYKRIGAAIEDAVRRKKMSGEATTLLPH
jgi:hypothetical protein